VYIGANHGFHNDTTPRYDEAAAKTGLAADAGLAEQISESAKPRVIETTLASSLGIFKRSGSWLTTRFRAALLLWLASGSRATQGGKAKNRVLRGYRISQGYRIILDWRMAYGLSLTMPNPTKQFEDPGWAAGYADGYIDGLEEAWVRINAEIERRPMPQRERDQSRNGLLLACKLIARPRK
jgi:hypothetical protein